MKVEQAISLYQEYHKVNSKKTPSTHTGTRSSSDLTIYLFCIASICGSRI
jgi:hypothetical protein